MKLQCQIEVINRLHCNHNIRLTGKYLKSTLALAKEPKRDEYILFHFSSINKTGTKYIIKNLKQVFVKCINEGKSTIRFEEPPHDLCIKSEVSLLKTFMKLLKQCITGDVKDLKVSSVGVTVTKQDIAQTKLTVRDRSEFPLNGFPKTLVYLNVSGLNLCSFRSGILFLKHLQVLDLSNNEIEKVPPDLGKMPCLAELHLSNNQLGIKGDIDWRWISGPQVSKQLKLLDISGNKLKYLPKCIWKLQRLVTLKVDNNFLDKLPATLGRICTLRYLTISKNKLESLPCSLMQCRLEHLDICSNNFQNVDTKAKWNKYLPWDYYVGNLVNMASKVVLKQKLFYTPEIIPRTLVQFLDNANMCICGAPVLNDMYFVNKIFRLKDYFNAIIFDSVMNGMVSFECYYCSPRCLSK